MNVGVRCYSVLFWEKGIVSLPNVPDVTSGIEFGFVLQIQGHNAVYFACSFLRNELPRGE